MSLIVLEYCIGHADQRRTEQGGSNAQLGTREFVDVTTVPPASARLLVLARHNDVSVSNRHQQRPVREYAATPAAH